MPNQAAIFTIGDEYASNASRDETGDALIGILTKMDWTISLRAALPDDEDQIAHTLVQTVDAGGVDAVFTIDGVGLDLKDRGAEALYKVCERWVTGLPEIIRIKLYEKNPAIALYRGLAGIRGKTLVINLPATPGSVRDAMDVLKPILRSTVEVLKGTLA